MLRVSCSSSVHARSRPRGWGGGLHHHLVERALRSGPLRLSPLGLPIAVHGVILVHGGTGGGRVLVLAPPTHQLLLLRLLEPLAALEERLVRRVEVVQAAVPSDEGHVEPQELTRRRGIQGPRLLHRVERCGREGHVRVVVGAAGGENDDIRLRRRALAHLAQSEDRAVRVVHAP